jgi:hypothetical protein
MMTLYL